MSLSKDGSTVHFVSHDIFQSYNDNTAHWGPTINLTTSLDSQYGEHVVTDVDMGLVYSLGSMWEQNGDFVRSFSTFDPVSRTVAKVNSAPRAGVLFTQGVYSSTRKSLFYLSQGNTFALYEYSIASDTWTYVVNGRNTLLPNGGRTLIVAAGAKRFRDYLLEGCKYSSNGESYEKTCAPKGNIVLDDVYEFDVETSVWTKISTTPVGYFNAVCAVSGDSLILYGGYQEFDGSIGLKVPNSNVPSIFNLKTNNWVSEYAPS
ncbi:hypothetical protein BG003_004655 [Podila horticola]|nr:hypothetical protein BG003_004655 [Podila horticola]